MPSLSSRLVPAYLRITRANRMFVSASEANKHIEQSNLRPLAYGPPRSLRKDVSVTVDRGLGWPVYTLTPRAGNARGTLVYVHGGGWVNEIAVQHWSLVAQIAAEAQFNVLVPIYPLVPLGTADQAVSAVVDLLAAALTRHHTVAVAGDSAGGQIALSAAVALRDERGLALSRTVLISPAVDLSLTNPQIDLVQPSDPWLGRDGGRVFAEYWRGRLPIDHPRVSPLFADFQGLGPLTVFSGTRDILNPDIRLLVKKAAAAGVDVDHHEMPGLVHVYPLTPTREGRAARALMVRQLRTAAELPATGVRAGGGPLPRWNRSATDTP